MIVNVSQLLKEPVGSTRTVTIEGEGYDAGAPLGVLTFTGHARLTRTPRSILVDGTFVTQAPAECSRCLEPAQVRLEITFAEEYFPSIDIHSGLPVPIPEEDGYRISANHLLNLGDAARDYAVMAMPIAPLCRPDCLGICPICGVTRNLTPCDHADEPVHPQLVVLRELLAELD
jgi:uncharacterized protein